MQTFARTALDRRRVALESCQTHLIETTLSGKGIIRHVQTARNKGYMVSLHYVSVYTPEAAIDRIRNRVSLGGHNVQKEDVRRRFARSHANLPAMIGLSDEVYLYDNTGPDKPNRIIGVFRNGGWETDIPVWALVAIQKSTNFVQQQSMFP
ncbi:MAG: hypothetical protein OXF20_14470 [Gammaproteobacteria bacterium]|nr:hypothetical protein [Gammaproteobacteria bacterium]